MNDIVERLLNSRDGWSSDALCIEASTGEEAADEIERLRAEKAYLIEVDVAELDSLIAEYKAANAVMKCALRQVINELDRSDIAIAQYLVRECRAALKPKP